MLMDVLSRRVPTEDIGMTCRNAPEDGAAAAIRRARFDGVWAADNTASAAIAYFQSFLNCKPVEIYYN